ncbi:MAG: SMC family ATPase, partial [Clostridium sp.]|nr:SMC family ATPase [Clostridium sp.]
MIPIYLKMEGFLTFKNPTLINFEDFVDSGIFLVSGPTGSGKTSIFDAISYALYGKATGGGREAKELRSHLIGDDDEFSVEFKFRSGKDEYLINRWQKGQRAGKVRLVVNDDDENPITKVREINDKIFEVLGLNADQFCKIVMLPQGEFRNFLSSSSKEKSEILRKLFDTDHYAQIREMIRKRLGQILGQVKEAKTLIDSEKTISDAARQAEDPEEILSILKKEWQEKEKESQALKVQLDLLRTKANNLF